MIATVDFRYAPASSWTAICRADEADKTLVREDGALLYGFRARHWLAWRFDRVVELSLQSDDRPLSVEQSTETARDAIVVTTLTYPQAVLRLRAFRHTRDGRAYDIVQWSVLADSRVDELPVALHVDIYDQRHGFVSGRVGAARTIRESDDADEIAWWYDTRGPQPGDGAAVVLESVDQPLAATHATGFRPVAGFVTAPVVVPGGGRSAGAIVIPLDGRPVGVDSSWVTDALDETRRYWSGLWPDGLPIAVPDAGIQQLLEASARNLLQAREERDRARQFQVGHALYRGLWMADGYFILEAARYLHLDDDVDQAVDGLRAHVRDDGSITSMSAERHLKETGIAIATILRQCELAGPPENTRAWWGVVERAVDYIETLRTEAGSLPPECATHGLLPPSFGDGGIAGVRAEYTTALWLLAGLRFAVDAADSIGADARDRCRKVFEELRTAFLVHADKNSRTSPDGVRYVPMVLDGQHHTIPHLSADSPEVRVRPETATWALAHAIWPGEVFALDAPITQDFLNLLDTRDDEEDIPATSGWLPYRALWTYYASFAAHAWLYAGRPDKAASYLYGFANHAAPTRVWREEQPLRGSGHSQVNGDMPHNWASAELIRLVRHLLVFERGRELDLLPGVPSGWLEAGAEIRLDRTPTRFGRVSLRVLSDGAGGLIEVLIDVHRPPERCVLHVPPGEWHIAAPDGQVDRFSGPARHEMSCVER